MKKTNHLRVALEELKEDLAAVKPAVATEGLKADDPVKSRSPGSRGKEGKVLTIKGDNVLVDFGYAKLSVPAAHLDLVK